MTLEYLGLDALVGCKNFKDPVKCQQLANLCVAMDYNLQIEYCQVFNDLVRNEN